MSLVKLVLEQFYLLLFLTGIVLLLLALIGRFSLRKWFAISVDSNIARSILFILGIIFVAGAVGIYFKQPSSTGGPVSPPEKAIIDYYRALDTHSANGYERAWNLLSQSKQESLRNAYHWRNSRDFAEGFRTTLKHESVVSRFLSSTPGRLTYRLFFIAIDGFPKSQARLQLSSKPAKDVFNSKILNPIIDDIIHDLSKYYERPADVNDQQIKRFIESQYPCVILSPELVEVIAFNFKLRMKTETLPTNIFSQTDLERVTRVFYQERDVVNEGGNWLLDNVTEYAVGVFTP